MLQYIGNTGAAGCPRSQKKESHIRAERNFFMLDRVQLKYEAKAITKNAAVSAYLFTLLYLAIGLVIGYVKSKGYKVVPEAFRKSDMV